jgi:serine/threonine-protein kinase RsbW
VRTSTAGPGGGDLLLSQATPDGQLVVLADLMGHGTDAKLYAHTLAGYLHGLLATDSARWTPATLLDAISRAFRDDALLTQTLATLVVVELAEAGRVTLASAGHPPAWRISRAGCEPLELSGALPGLAEDARYEQLGLVLEPGERLALYTDGLVELRGAAAAEAGLIADLTGTLAAQGGAELDAAADAAWSVWQDRVGAQPEDDATLVLFERDL